MLCKQLRIHVKNVKTQFYVRSKTVCNIGIIYKTLINLIWKYIEKIVIESVD